jgi:FtsH-binding integral membrane protein
MTWFGMASAWGAALMAAMFAVNAYFQFATGVPYWIYAVVATGLGVGAFRTIRKMSGGLRLLAGAWGLAAGVLMLPLTVARSTPLSAAEAALIAAAFIGLALTVLHKETK